MAKKKKKGGMGKKGAMTLTDLAPVAIAFVFVAIVMGVGADVLADIQTDQVTDTAGCNSTAKTSCGADYNASGNGLSSLSELSSWLPTIALVIAAAIVIGVLSFFRS
jgi:hypothetical protein